MGTRNEPSFEINGRKIGPSHPVYVIAEMSANHGHSLERAEEILKRAAAAGVDAVKLQTYTADTLTIDCKNEYFTLNEGPWAGRTLYDLYEEAHTPWEWQPELKRMGDELGVEVFSSPFDATSVDFLEQEVGVRAYKIASFEVVDIPLLQKVASTGKPVIMSTGLATEEEIDRAITTLRQSGSGPIALLSCMSAYPAVPEQMNLKTISYLSKRFDVVSGLSDHSLEPAVPVAAVALGASIIEKHVTLHRSDGGPDAHFSLEPAELSSLVTQIRHTHEALGTVFLGVKEAESASIAYRKSIFAVEDIRLGEPFTSKNIRVIRPGFGLEPMHLMNILGNTAAKDIQKGTPISWDLIDDPDGK